MKSFIFYCLEINLIFRVYFAPALYTTISIYSVHYLVDLIIFVFVLNYVFLVDPVAS